MNPTDEKLLEDLRMEMAERQVEMLPVLKPKEAKSDTEEYGGEGCDSPMPELR